MSSPSTPIPIPKSPRPRLAQGSPSPPFSLPFTIQAPAPVVHAPPSSQDLPPPSLKKPVYGLTYPAGLLKALSVLEPVQVPPLTVAPAIQSPPSKFSFLKAEPRPASPIRTESTSSPSSTHVRLLPLSTFSSMHLRSTLSHAPDHVLFPFLHGLEQSNSAQSTFFLSPAEVEQGVEVPRYRGLMWVVCEEDLDAYLLEHPPTHSQRLGRNGEYWSDGDSEYDDIDIDEDMDLDNDYEEMVAGETWLESEQGRPVKKDQLTTHEQPTSMDIDHSTTPVPEDPNDAPHMHPVQARPHAIQTNFTHPTLAPAFIPSPTHSIPPYLTSSPSTPSAAVVDNTTVHASPPFSYKSSPRGSDGSSGDRTISETAAAAHDRRSSNASTTSSTYTTFTDDSAGSSSLAPSSPASSWAPGSPTSAGAWTAGSTPCSPTIAEEAEAPALMDIITTVSAAQSTATLPPGTPSPVATPPPQLKTTTECPLLTSSFHTHELLKTRWVSEGKYDGRKEVRLGSDGKAEFLPLKVPEGISLRNFGIQVPIMVTLSDIVVYSPKGRTPAAVKLAQRFAEAVEKKKLERQERRSRVAAEPAASTGKSMGYAETKAMSASLSGTSLAQRDDHGSATDVEDESDEGPLSYNVFLLDATAEEMSRYLPHLMVRFIEGDEALPCSKDKDHGGPYTDGSDGHVEQEGMFIDGEPSSTDRTDTKPFKRAHAKEMAYELARRPNTVNFALREREEMRDLTKASEIISVYPLALYPGGGATSPSRSGAQSPQLEPVRKQWDPAVGEVYLGNSNDVPVVPDAPAARPFYPAPAVASNYTSSPYSIPTAAAPPSEDPFNFTTNDPAEGLGYDICIECHDMAPFPSVASLVAADDQLHRLDAEWTSRARNQGKIRPPPNAKSVVHLPFPSSPPSSAATLAALLPLVRFIERWLQPPQLPSALGESGTPGKRWTGSPPSTSYAPVASHVNPYIPMNRNRSSTFSSNNSPSPSALPSTPVRTTPRTRPLKVLVYSADGYTESSVLALCLLMAVKRLTLPEAYLELQVVKRRSFFVYQPDLSVLQRVESRLISDRDQERKRVGEMGRARMGQSIGPGLGIVSNRDKEKRGDVGRQWMGYPNAAANAGDHPGYTRSNSSSGRPAANSVSSSSFGVPGTSLTSEPASFILPGTSLPPQPLPAVAAQTKSRPRASTSPWLPSLFPDHQTWFGDPRFDGSFPSRVLPFLYLGNLNHATNAYMLHALGITHVVSVGECALVPPSTSAAAASCRRPTTGVQFIAGQGPGTRGSLWIEEREGRIKVLDIKGVCDDGIDTLEPQLEPICAWIEKARAEGGQVLVHCRVGVSRSATVTIAYVMKHLNLPLVDAYLIVRSRRLSVLIQPNMRLLYNLCGWEVRLARDRAGDDEDLLRAELARTLTWPFFSKEVHALNEKYLHN